MHTKKITMLKYILYPLVILLLSFLFFYFGLPTLRYGYSGFPIAIIFVSGNMIWIDRVTDREKVHLGWTYVFIGIVVCCLIYIFIIPIFSTWAMFNSSRYRNLIGEVQKGDDFSTHVAPISTEKIRIIDEYIAYRLGDKVLGSQPSLGSQVDIGRFNIQKVRNKLYWVAPLLHSGFFKWNNNKEGTPGYVMVSATNERDVKLVQDLDGKPIKIKYQPAAFFGANLARHIYFHGYMTQGYTDFTFEIDDNGKPFWVVTLYEKKVGFSGRDAKGIVVVDAHTGEIEEYSIDKAPKWVDRIQPAEFIEKQLNDWGEYVKGYWNFANENKLMITSGLSLVYGENDQSYWYTGLTSVGSDEGTVGFVLVDTRTKETTWYKQVGATEQAAQYSAMGKVQEKGYNASFPITYNINGIPTYVMSLKDQAGLIKMVAMVSVEDYTIVGIGNDLKDALREYKNAYNSAGNTIAPTSSVKTFKVETAVKRISRDIRNGNTFYYLILENYENKIFIGSSSISNELPLTEVQDTVLVKYDDGAGELVDITSFDNLGIATQKTKQQQEIEGYHQKK